LGRILTLVRPISR